MTPSRAKYCCGAEGLFRPWRGKFGKPLAKNESSGVGFSHSRPVIKDRASDIYSFGHSILSRPADSARLTPYPAPQPLTGVIGAPSRQLINGHSEIHERMNGASSVIGAGMIELDIDRRPDRIVAGIEVHEG